MCTNLRIILIKAQNPKVSSEGGSSFRGKSQKSPPEADPPSEEKIKTLIISSHCEPPPKFRGTKQSL